MGDSIEDEDFNYREDQNQSDDEAFHGTAKSTMVQNQPHDEEVALSDTESFGGRDEPPNVKDASLIESHDMDELPAGGTPIMTRGSAKDSDGAAGAAAAGQEARPGRLAGMPQEANDSVGPNGEIPGAYNAMDFKHLHVSDDIKALFQYIGRYKPQTIDLETKLKPFIPDYIPSVGGLDEFIKVPRPDGKPDLLGLKVLDEPAARQSDPTVLTLQLRQLSKEAPGNKAEMIGRIEHTDEHKAKKISGWIGSINDIHKSKPAATVSYARRMPDIEDLMQEWPPEMEAFLRNMQMPTGELDLDLKAFTKLVCSVLDIPVYENPIESLHVLFSLYLEFKANPVFGQQLMSSGADDPGMASLYDPGNRSMGMGSSPATPVWQGGRNSTSAASSQQGMGTIPHVPSSGANVMTF